MKCPSCGKELQKNSLFCEQCGNEIYVVPDFETEVENNMEEHLEKIKKTFELPEMIQTTLHHKKLFYRLGFLCVLAIVFVFVILIQGRFNGYRNAEDYVEKARKEFNDGNLDKAGKYFEEAIAYDPERTDAMQELAEIYFLRNEKEKYENILKSLISNELLLENDLISCYGKLIAFYNASGESEKIKTLLNQCETEAVRTAYEDYYAPVPRFSVQEGYYTKVMPVMIDGPKNGVIYYTLDGTEPTTDSRKYEGPIILEEGDYTVRAVYVSKANIYSDEAKASYHIEMIRPESPVVVTTSGTYTEPTYIEIEMEENTRVYYTTDGSIPNENSYLYEEPLLMPLGKTVYRFVSMKDGLVSEVVERIYEMEIPHKLSEEEARNHLLAYLMQSGRIQDYFGNTLNSDKVYYYTYLTYCVIREKMYYVFRESSSDSEMEMTQLYGVDAMDGSVVTLKYENDISYSLVEINNP